MSKVMFCSDLHLGHKNIHNFRCKEKGFFRDFSCEEEHANWIVEEWSKQIVKRDTIFCLGDITFTEGAVELIKTLPGRKILICGNHDYESTKKLLEAFENVFGLFRYKKHWLSHCPIHSEELRGRTNLHGHTHNSNIDDNRYFNCCVESLMNVFGSPFVNYNEIKEKL